MTAPTAEQLFYEALALQQANVLSEAEQLYRRALELAPDRPSILLNLAVVLVGQQKFDEAERLCMGLLRSNGNDEDALLTLGTCQSGMGRKSEALETFDRTTRIHPDAVDAWNGRGNVLLDFHRAEAALESFDRALRIAPDHPDVLNNRGTALVALERYSEAIVSFDQSLRARPDSPVVFTNRGRALMNLNRTRPALENFDEAIRISPEYARAHWNASLCWLSLGDFPMGWEQYDWGWKDGERGPPPTLAAASWDGRPVDGTLLVWAEQGIGDQILFCGMLAEVERLARQVVLAVDARLVPLLQRSFPRVHVVAKDDALGRVPANAQVPLGGLGKFLRRAWTDFPQKNHKYLFSNDNLSSSLRGRFSGNRRLCGVSWISRNNAAARAKSIALSDLQPVLALDHLQAIDLQYGDTAEERAQLQATSSIQVAHVDDIDNFNDIDGLAALIDACDVVVTVSNTTAHLAGALGKPTLLMVPFGAGRHWYWHEERDDSPWYPSVSIFRQAEEEAWSEVIARVTSVLLSAFLPT